MNDQLQSAYTTHTSMSTPMSLLARDQALSRVGVEVVSRGGGDTPYNGLYGEAPPERGTFFRLEVCERVGISRVQVWEKVGKTTI